MRAQGIKQHLRELLRQQNVYSSKGRRRTHPSAVERWCVCPADRRGRRNCYTHQRRRRRAERKRPDPEGPVLYDSTEAKASIRFPRTRGDGPCECGQRWDRQEVSGGFWGLGHDPFLDPSGGYGDCVFNNHLLSRKLRCYPLIYVLCVHSKKMA